MVLFIERFKKLPTWILVCHLLARIVIGMGVGVLLAHYLENYAWWIILAAIILALPAKFKMIKVYRTMSTNIVILSLIAGVLFGTGLGLIFIAHLQAYGWWILALGLVLSVPGCYKIWANK